MFDGYWTDYRDSAVDIHGLSFPLAAVSGEFLPDQYRMRYPCLIHARNVVVSQIALHGVSHISVQL